MASATKSSAPACRWAGPNGPGPEGGITNSLLSRFLTCRERFRRLVVDGWKPAESHLNERLEYGNMWHVCEEAAASEVSHFKGELGGTDMTLWVDRLDEYARGLHKKYPFERDATALMYAKIRYLFPEYIRYWAAHPDVIGRTPLLQEKPFDVQYKLPSGRYVRLRGKWDAVDLIGGCVYLQENKTKSTVDGTKIGRHVTNDLQTMLYLVALDQSTDLRDTWPGDPPIAGTRYNVVRRPLHKSIESTIKKYTDDRDDNRTGEWFGRWRIEVGPEDLARFRREVLDPILESLVDWWDHVTCCARAGDDPFTPNPGSLARLSRAGSAVHWRTPYYYNPISEGGSGDLDALLDTGSTAGLVRADTLFPELRT